MQQHTTSSTSSGAGWDDAARTQEIALLHADLERIIWRLAELEPSDLATVPVALPLALAQLMSDQARRLDVPLAGLMVSYLLHGGYHTASEAGDPEAAQEIAALIRRLSPPDVWRRFVQRHPGVRL